MAYELLYEKGTIQKYYIEESENAEKTFKYLISKAGDHILVKYAKSQLDNESIENESEKIDNQEQSNDFSIASYPNPFNPSTTITYQIPKDGLVNLVVYNTLGQVVKELVNEHQTSGKYTVQFNATGLSSGVYFYKLQAGAFSKVNKMLLVR